MVETARCNVCVKSVSHGEHEWFIIRRDGEKDVGPVDLGTRSAGRNSSLAHEA